MGLLEIFYIFY